jgi:putative CocE/NonD family hydrolase
MSVASRMVERFLDLPDAVTRDVRVRRDLPITMRDGVVLRADHYAPAIPGAPTVLIRTPYGRRGVLGLVTGRVLAERGFHVVLAGCRGTFDSGGAFEPMRHEHADGLDTLDWLRTQDFYRGELYTYGPSYVGFTQWAIAADAGPELRAMLTAVTASSFREATYAGGSFSLDTILNWATLVRNQGGSLLSFAVKQGRTQPHLRRAWTHLPLAEVDSIASGAEIEFFQQWLASAADDEYWADRAHDERIEKTTAAVCMVGGWYDIFLPWQLQDYARLRRAGARPRLVVGPWTHASRELFARSMREGIEWFRGGVPASVELYVGGAEEWRSFPDWPPDGREVDWDLGGKLVPDGPEAFTYDPADPTPSPGGPLFTAAGGRRDNTEVEQRADVLTYTSAPLDEAVEAIGPVSATIRLRSTSAHFDVFARVCDVDPAGRSENICDGLTRIDATVPRWPAPPTPPAMPADGDGVRAVDVALWPTAYRFAPGHRIRVQIAGGAHPRYARHTGTDEPMPSARTLRPVSHEVLGGSLRLWSP